MNITIIGGGAVGLLFYQALYRIQTLKNIRLSLYAYKPISPSFTFTNNAGLSYAYPIHTSQKGDLQQADIVLLCVKSYQVTNVLENIESTLNPNATIILCHNGMGSIDEYFDRNNKQNSPKLLSQTILSLLITHGSKKNSKLHITHTGQGIGNLGLIKGGYTKQQSNKITTLFNVALPTISWHEDIKEKQWLKLAINSVINPLTALNNMVNGDVLQPQYQQQITRLLNEFIAIAHIKGIYFSLPQLLNIITEVANKTSLNRSSMLSDIDNKQQTEIDYINGYLVKIGKLYDIPTPEHDNLTQQINALTLAFI